MDLSKFQKEIIDASIDSRQLIISGPGTGKTFCLIERLKNLFKNNPSVSPNQILVLSFSVAAINEIMARLIKSVSEENYPIALSYLTPKTFDSFATYFISILAPETNLSNKNYDERIALATEIISSNEDAQNEIKYIKHVFIDEIQDLVGHRASLTKAILSQIKCGFTLLGDPAQAIYDYTNKELDTIELCNWLKSQFNDIVILSDDNLFNYRISKNNLLKTIYEEGRRNILRAQNISSIFGYLNNLESIGKLSRLEIKEEFFSNTAILCRNNGQVLSLANNLNNLGIEFFIRRRKEERTIPPWIGKIFFDYNDYSITKKQFIHLYVHKIPSSEKSPEDFWDNLSPNNNLLDVEKLRLLLKTEKVFDDDIPYEENKIILSSIHRAKGREFENVIIYFENRPFCNFAEELQEAKVLYVALTRAKKNLFKISFSGFNGLKKYNDRWINKEHYDDYVQVGIDHDIDIHSFVSREIHDSNLDIEYNQEIIWSEVKYKTPVKLDYCHKLKKYQIKVQSKTSYITIGAMSDYFTDSITQIFENKIPKSIDNIWIKDIITEVGDLNHQDIPKCYNNAGLWLGVKLEGLGKCHWN